MTRSLPPREPSFRQILRLIADIRPTFHVESVKLIDAAFLRAHDIEGVIWDIDGTLMGYHAKEIDPSFAAHVRSLFEDPSVRHCILSNCDEKRFGELGDIIPDVPILRAYRKSNGYAYRTLLHGKDSFTGEQLGDLLARGAKLIRKPSKVLIEMGMRVLKVEDHDKVLMIGDQYLTDIASARLAGVKSVKVLNFDPGSFSVRLQRSQRFERMLFRLRHGRPMWQAGGIAADG